MGSCPFSEKHVDIWDAKIEMESMIEHILEHCHFLILFITDCDVNNEHT